MYTHIVIDKIFNCAVYCGTEDECNTFIKDNIHPCHRCDFIVQLNTKHKGV